MKYTVITGASSGIGYETAFAFAARGKHLVLVARRLDKLEELRSAIQQSYPNVDVVVRSSDLAVVEQAHDLYNSLKEFQIETWINNAGLSVAGLVVENDLKRVEDMLNVNINSLSVLTLLYVRDYVNVEGAQLINVSSGLGYYVPVTSVGYAATKFFVSAWTEGLAKELEVKGAKLRAKVLAPGATETDMIKNTTGIEDFDFKANIPMYHTAKQMAGFMLELYDSNAVVGIVDESNYEFKLRDQIHPVRTEFLS
ncbi:SDR family NAD(P)-dependent oxidoreductase [Paenibacillus massiliensis]|uniref:SDR family NAD(P)-dependent oxidoreductase n=1 Tax=Paenibacillus massiliensis TaxID=225917 RepID=UPI000381D275|nr:SDR family NAD(P)-dependent oxidoreductase [Paenibacillus massiliensis]